MGCERLNGLLSKGGRREFSFRDTKNMVKLFIRKGVDVCGCVARTGRGRNSKVVNQMTGIPEGTADKLRRERSGTWVVGEAE